MEKGTWKEEIDTVFNMGLLIPYLVGYRCSKCKKISENATEFCSHCDSPMKPFNKKGEKRGMK